MAAWRCLIAAAIMHFGTLRKWLPVFGSYAGLFHLLPSESLLLGRLLFPVQVQQDHVFFAAHGRGKPQPKYDASRRGDQRQRHHFANE